MDTELAWLALTLVPGVGARTFHRLIQRFGSPEKVFAASRLHLEQVPGLRSGSIDAIRSLHPDKAAREERIPLKVSSTKGSESGRTCFVRR